MMCLFADGVLCNEYGPNQLRGHRPHLYVAPCDSLPWKDKLEDLVESSYYYTKDLDACSPKSHPLLLSGLTKFDVV